MLKRKGEWRNWYTRNVEVVVGVYPVQVQVLSRPPENIMKKLLLFILTSLLIPLLLPSKTFAGSEYIQNYTATINIQQEGTILVKESIDYYFPAPGHGIFRKVPLIKTNEQGDKYRMSAELLSVTDASGKPYTYQDLSTSREINLKIGDPDKTIQGMHTYNINYKISGALTYFENFDELYWNITGNDWEIPIRQVTATIILPENIPIDKANLSCYTGKQGSTATNCTADQMDNRLVFETTNLGSYEGLTVVISLPKGFVEVLEPSRDSLSIFTTILIILLAVVVLLFYVVAPIFVFLKWFRSRRPEEKRVVAAWFEPPKNKQGELLTASQTGLLLNKVPDMKQVTSALIQLAYQGYIKIKEQEKGLLKQTKEYEFHLLKDYSGLPKFESDLLAILFEKQTVVTTKELAKSQRFAKKLSSLQKTLSKELVTEGFFEEDPYKKNTLYSIIGVIGAVFFNIFLAIASFGFGRKSTKRTAFGAQAAAKAESLKNFLASQDKQLEFQSQNQLFFEKLLPYAVAFGVEKVWIERFKNITLEQPEWFESSSGKVFSAATFNSSLSSLSGSVAASSGRSSSGFSSGSSGGGFSGSGGGGGGGGSW